MNGRRRCGHGARPAWRGIGRKPDAPAMDLRDLAQRLLEAGCNPSLYAIGSRGMLSDGFCLDHHDGRWRVYHTERGQDAPPQFSSTSEAEACDYFHRLVMSMRHDHCVGFFRAQADASVLAERLSALGIQTWSDCIPFGGMEDPRHRVFVMGKAVFAAREALGALPVGDCDG